MAYLRQPTSEDHLARVECVLSTRGGRIILSITNIGVYFIADQCDFLLFTE